MRKLPKPSLSKKHAVEAVSQFRPAIQHLLTPIYSILAGCASAAFMAAILVLVSKCQALLIILSPLSSRTATDAALHFFECSSQLATACLPAGLSALIIWSILRKLNASPAVAFVLAMWAAVLTPICALATRELNEGIPISLMFWQAWAFYYFGIPALVNGLVAIVLFEFLRKIPQRTNVQIVLLIPMTKQQSQIQECTLLDAEFENALRESKMRLKSENNPDFYTIIITGQNADQILETVKPLLKHQRLPPGSYVEVRRDNQKNGDRIELDCFSQD